MLDRCWWCNALTNKDRFCSDICKRSFIYAEKVVYGDIEEEDI